MSKRIRKVTMDADIDVIADALLRFVRRRHKSDTECHHYTNLVNILRELAWTPVAEQPPAPGEVTERMVQAGVAALMSSAIACEMRLPETEEERREVVTWIYREMLAAAAPEQK